MTGLVTFVGTAWFGPWWLVYQGPVGPTDVHAHHALQAVSGADLLIERSGVVGPAPVIVEPNERHRIVHGGDAVLVYVDGDLTDRRPHPSGDWSRSTSPRCWADAAELAEVVRGPIPTHAGPVPEVVTLARRALADPDDVRSLGRIAVDLSISPSRLAHVFTQYVGTSMGSYRRWQRLLLAAEAIAGGSGLTAAAHDAGFADGPHLARTFRHHFGLSVRELTQAVRFSTS